MLMITHTHTHNNVPTLKGVGVKGFVGERLRNRPLRVSASYDQGGETQIQVYTDQKRAICPSEASSFFLGNHVGVNESSLSLYYIRNICM